MPRILAFVFLALAALASACSSGGRTGAPATATAVPADAAVYTAPGPHLVGVTTLDLVDTSRPTPPNGDYAGSGERRLPTEVWYPARTGAEGEEAVDAAVEGGPYPLVVFAHGYSSFRRQSASFARHLASHGYVVASPDFPTTGLAAPGGARLAGVLDQPADVSFVIDAMMRFNEMGGHRFEGAFDGRVGLTGHSLGGLTTLLTTFGPLRDDRVMAAAPFSAPACFFGEGIAGDVRAPVMHVGGSDDLIVNRSSIRRGYEVSNAPRYYVELTGGDHLGFTDLDIGDEALISDLRTGLLSRERNEDDARAIAERLGADETRCEEDDAVAGGEAIPKARQRELMRFFGALFFDAHLRGNERALALLRSGAFGDIAPEAAVEFE